MLRTLEIWKAAAAQRLRNRHDKRDPGVDSDVLGGGILATIDRSPESMGGFADILRYLF